MAKVPYSREHTGNRQTDAIQDGYVHRVATAVNALPFTGGTLVREVSLPGIRGRVKAISGVTLTLWNPEDVKNFPSSKVIEAAQTDGSTGVKRSGSVTVVDVDVMAGTVTANTAWTTGIPALTTNDYLFGVNEFGPPIAGSVPGTYTSGSVITLYTQSVVSGGVIATRVIGSQPAQFRTLQVNRPQGLGSKSMTVVLESRFATTADLWLF